MSIRAASLIGNDILWQSMRWDAEVGLYYMRHRWYDPYLGRFLTPDPIGAFGDPLNFGNVYTFPAHNPWSYRDPWGLSGDGCAAEVQDWGAKMPSVPRSSFRALLNTAWRPGTFSSAAQTNSNTSATNAQITGGLDAGRTAAIEGFDFGTQTAAMFIPIPIGAVVGTATAIGISNLSGPVAASVLRAYRLMPTAKQELVRRGNGPGLWTRVNEHMSQRARDYQRRVSGAPDGTAYVVDGVRFDSYVGGVLIDAKGPGYASYCKRVDGRLEPRTWWFPGKFQKVLDQAETQNRLARQHGHPVQWHVAEEDFADLLRRTFQREPDKYGLIEVIHTPF